MTKKNRPQLKRKQGNTASTVLSIIITFLISIVLMSAIFTLMLVRLEITIHTLQASISLGMILAILRHTATVFMHVMVYLTTPFVCLKLIIAIINMVKESRKNKDNSKTTDRE